MKSIEQHAPSREHAKKDFEAGRLAWYLGASAIALGSVLAVGNLYAVTKPNHANLNNIYPEVSSVTIENGAELLSDPPTDSSKIGYVLYELNLDGTAKTIDIPTPGGVSEVFFKGHKFIGIPVTDLPPELQTKVKDDSDGKFWVDGEDGYENPDQQ